MSEGLGDHIGADSALFQRAGVGVAGCVKGDAAGYAQAGRYGAKGAVYIDHYAVDALLLLFVRGVEIGQNREAVVGYGYGISFQDCQGDFVQGNGIMGMGFPPLVFDAAGPQIFLAQVGDVYQVHAAGIKAEKEHVAGEAFFFCFNWSVLDAFNVVDGDGAFGGWLVQVPKRVRLKGIPVLPHYARFYGAVANCAQGAHIGSYAAWFHAALGALVVLEAD